MNKTINFNHNSGLIYSGDEQQGYIMSLGKWIPATQNLFKLTDIEADPIRWESNKIYKAGDCVCDANKNLYLCLRDNDSGITALQNNPNYWKDYTSVLSNTKLGDIVGEYVSYTNECLHSEYIDVPDDKDTEEYVESVWKTEGSIVKPSVESGYNKLEADDTDEPTDHSVFQLIHVKPNQKICFSCYCKPNTTRNIGLSLRVGNIKNSKRFTSLFNMEYNALMYQRIYDINYEESATDNTLKDVLGEIHRFNIEGSSEHYYRISITARTTMDCWIEASVHVPNPDYEICYAHDWRTQGIIKVDFDKCQLDAGEKGQHPYTYMKSDDSRPFKGIQNVRYCLNTLNGYQQLDRPIYFADSVEELPQTADEDSFGFVGTSIYFPNGIKLGTREDDIIEERTNTYYNETDNEYHLTTNLKNYKFKVKFDTTHQMLMSETFNKYGFYRLGGHEIRAISKIKY